MNWHDPRDDYDDEPWKGRFTTERLAKEMADMMWSFGMFQLGASLLASAQPIIVLIGNLSNGAPIADRDWLVGSAMVAGGLAGFALAIIVVRGSTAMKQFRRYGLAVAAALLILFSLPCVFAAPFSTPLGIWALIVLRRRDVRARFEAVARGTIPSRQT